MKRKVQNYSTKEIIEYDIGVWFWAVKKNVASSITYCQFVDTTRRHRKQRNFWQFEEILKWRWALKFIAHHCTRINQSKIWIKLLNYLDDRTDTTLTTEIWTLSLQCFSVCIVFVFVLNFNKYSWLQKNGSCQIKSETFLQLKTVYDK
jgi:hypothetical protein